MFYSTDWMIPSFLFVLHHHNLCPFNAPASHKLIKWSLITSTESSISHFVHNINDSSLFWYFILLLDFECKLAFSTSSCLHHKLINIFFSCLYLLSSQVSISPFYYPHGFTFGTLLDWALAFAHCDIDASISLPSLCLHLLLQPASWVWHSAIPSQ